MLVVTTCCAGFLLGIFFRGGGQNLLLCKFLLLFYCFRTKFQGKAKVFKEGANCLRGRPCPPCGRKPVSIYKSSSYIYLFNNCKEKRTFSTRPRVVRDQISQEVLAGIVIFLCLSVLKTCSFGLTKKLPRTDSFIYKKLLNYTAIFGSFSIPNEQRQ